MRHAQFAVLIGYVFAVAPALAQTTTTTAPAPSMMANWWWVIVLVLVGLAVWYFMKRRGGPSI